jgi:hypothetical protein
MTALDERVRRAWLGMNEPLEATVSTMYLDKIGLVTTATGVLIDSPQAAQALQWLRVGGSIADPADIAREWRRVKEMPPNLVWSAYRSATGLHLDAEEIERVVLARLDADAKIISYFWLAVWSDWPAAAQAAVCMLAWAVGAGRTASGITGPTWPHLHAALDVQDWSGAADAGQLRWSDNPGVRPRDHVIAALFRESAGYDVQTSRSFPAGPSRDAALKSLAAWDAAAAEGST